MVKTALKSLWQDTCTVYVQIERINEITKRTEFVEIPIFENEPCKLSFNSLTSAELIDNVSSKNQSITLFISNELKIPSGSKIIITRGVNVFTYTNSGEPKIFTNHQEIKLELFERWV